MTAALPPRPPLVGFCAPSGSGKTTLACRVIALLTEQGLRVGVLKQARDDFDVDRPGKDSHRLRKAGVRRLLIGSEHQSALITERAVGVDKIRDHDRGGETEPSEPELEEPELDELLGEFDPRLDLILVEGFAERVFPKIELIRAAAEQRRPPRYPHDPWVIAVASDAPLITELPQLDINDPRGVADFICRQLNTGARFGTFEVKP